MGIIEQTPGKRSPGQQSPSSQPRSSGLFVALVLVGILVLSGGGIGIYLANQAPPSHVPAEIVDEGSAPKPADPKADEKLKVIPPLPQPPTVAIASSYPAVLRAGGSLEIVLRGKADGGTLRFQYRGDEKEPWQTIPAGKLTLTDLTEGRLQLFFQAIDERGVVSTSLAASWSVNAAPLPTVAIASVQPTKAVAGLPLTIRVEGKHPDDLPLSFQYRLGPKEEWRRAPEGKIEIKTTPTDTALLLEVRAIDAKGNASPILGQIIALAPPAKLPDLIGGPIRLEWRLKEGDSFQQELIVAQKPSFRMQGLTFNSLLQYRVVSRFTVKKVAADGGLIVQQKVEEAKLLQADNVTQGLLAGVVAKLPGTLFTIHLNDKMDVTKFEGGGDGPQAMAPKLPAGQALQMASLMDVDGWKEMAQATFFQPCKGLKAGERWAKPMTHNWGPLGAWTGKIHYAYSGSQKEIHKVDYALELAYQAPKAGAGIMGIPIQGAKFGAPETAGSILFDAKEGRVTASEERFRVRGQITINLLGQNTTVDIEEEQQFSMRISGLKK